MMQCDTMLCPEDVYYTNDSISSTFSDGRSIYDAAASFNTHSLRVTDFPLMHVFRSGSCYFSRNNRHLWVFRNSGVDLVPVKLVRRPARSSRLLPREHVCVRYAR
ncbi:unnamed protein product [Symbiodinium natans]|uniref:Uncharacterized protein n=1 Tax=Symbiodinium natans TaxID=878477 RepID=A0A812RHX1_9DINO|nr:unnamed protein product [Symbiodinium natans]